MWHYFAIDIIHENGLSWESNSFNPIMHEHDNNQKLVATLTSEFPKT